LPGGSPGDLVQRADVVQLYQALVDELNGRLAQFERVKRLALLPRGIASPEGGTGAARVARRRAAQDDWRHVVDRLYADATTAKGCD
jgi:long-chain acyl-CoA synthetase